MPSESPKTTAAGSSYGQILKSSSILGGAQGVNLVLGLVRTKCVAVLLGPSGVGLIGLYSAATGMIGTFSGLGIGQSGVRQVAEAAVSGDRVRIARTVTVLRRVCWLTGALGWLLTAVLAWPLSQWSFGRPEHAGAIAILGVTVLLGNIAAGQTSMLQGMRRIGDIARLQVSAVVVGTIISICLYALFLDRAIVPVLLVSAVINLSISFWFARRIEIAPVQITWSETVAEARGLVGFGIVFMWSALLTAAVALLVQSLVRDRFGIEGNGIYQAAWSISGVFAGFILGAMGTDFYPRLTASASDNAAVNRLVNEQTEVGILLALPGLLATLCFSPWVIQMLYSARFAASSELLPWFVLGVFGRVVSWPLGYVQLAKGAGRWFIVTESLFSAVQVLLVWAGIEFLGLRGAAMAFAALYALYIVGMLWTTARLSQFRWSASVVRLLSYSSVAVLGSFLLSQFLPTIPLAAVGGVLVLVVGVLSLRQLIRRVGTQHRLARIPLRIPGLGPFLAR